MKMNMHDDAEKRLSEFVQGLDRPKSVAARIRAMLPLIEEARIRGATWLELVNVLGVPRATLLAAYSRARKKSAEPGDAP